MYKVYDGTILKILQLYHIVVLARPWSSTTRRLHDKIPPPPTPHAHTDTHTHTRGHYKIIQTDTTSDKVEANITESIELQSRCTINGGCVRALFNANLLA